MLVLMLAPRLITFGYHEVDLIFKKQKVKMKVKI